MPTITPHLWYDDQAVEAAELYVSLFPNSSVDSVSQIRNTPSGDCDVVSFRLAGLRLMSISAGPLFSFNPSISLLVSCQSTEEVDRYWETLGANGTVRMPLNEYPFSPYYGWTDDRYGLSWQFLLDENANLAQPITPSFLFVGDVCGKAEEAMQTWAGIIPNSEIGTIDRYPEGGPSPDEPGTVRFGQFTLAGNHFVAMDSAFDHDFSFNEAISLMVNCADQREIDAYWESMSAVPEAEQCGWLKDRFGVSWQIVPARLGAMMSEGTPEQIDRITQAFLPMKKFDVDLLERAYRGAPVG